MFYSHSKGRDEAVQERLLPSKTLRGIDFSYSKNINEALHVGEGHRSFNGELNVNGSNVVASGPRRRAHAPAQV